MIDQCEGCCYKDLPSIPGAHCYMFRDAPTRRCMQWRAKSMDGTGLPAPLSEAGKRLVTYALLGFIFTEQQAVKQEQEQEKEI